MFRIPPGELDEKMCAGDALDVLEYLSHHPETEEIVDVQIARVLQILTGEKDITRLMVRGRQPTEEEIAEDWIRYLDERENRIKNQPDGC